MTSKFSIAAASLLGILLVGYNDFAVGIEIRVFPLYFLLRIARLQRSFQKERAHSRTDHLTGLANSRSFYEQAEAIANLCRRNLRPMSLAFLDLDNFKHVNDTLGHEQGDAVLRKVAEILISSLRASDIAGRIGGGEFLCLLPATAPADAAVLLEKVRSRLAQTPQLQACFVPAKIGGVFCNNRP